MTDFLPPQDLQDKYKQLLEYAASELPDPATIQLTAWDDGDIKLKAVHTEEIRHTNGKLTTPPIIDRKEIIYDDGGFAYREREEYTTERNGKSETITARRRLE